MTDLKNYRFVRSIMSLAIAVAILGTGACSNLDVPDLQAPSLGDLTAAPTRSGVATAAQGLIAETRANAGNISSGFGAYAREGYNLDLSNPQGPANIYVALDKDQGSALWTTTYRVFKAGNVTLDASDKVGDYTAAEKAGVRGFVKTLQGLALLHLISGMDASGAALDVNATATDPLPAIAGKAQVYTRILQLLDDGASALATAGGTFAFQLPGGFTGFTTPATFLAFNKAVRARANVYNKNYAGALTDLGASFLSTTAPVNLTTGVFWDYSTNPGDAVNPNFDPTTRQRYAHPSFLKNAQLKADLTRDARALTKVAPIDTVRRNGFVVTEKLTVYNSNAAAIPIIRNEELILLRAEANLACNNAAPVVCAGSVGQRALALADINLIRVNSGGLAPIAVDPGVGGTGTGDRLLDELLYEKRYSLFWEQGTTWVDARNYGRLASLPKDRPGDLVFPYFSLPVNECNQRAPNAPATCNTPTGL